MTKIKAVMLDVYGTVLVPSGEVPECYDAMLRALGHAQPRDILMGDRKLLLQQRTSFSGYLARHAPPGLEAAKCQEILDNAALMLAAHEAAHQPCEEWEAFAKQCAALGLKTCLISNLSTPYTAIVDRKFPGVTQRFYSCEIGMSKPQAEFFHYACREMGVRPHEAVMAGNSYSSDVTGAMVSGIAEAFHVQRQMTAKENPADHVHRIRSLTEIVPRLETLGLL